MAQHAIVAFVMACFMELLLLLCYRMSLADDGAGDEASVPGITNVIEHFEASVSSLTPQFAPSKFIDGCVAVLSRQPEINFWASPPIGCCFALCPGLPCGRRQKPSAKLLALLRRAVFVYVLGAVLAPLLEQWVDGVPGLEEHHRIGARQFASVIETVVTLLALYSLFIAYRLSKGPLHSYRTTLKFATVKILVFASPLQRHLLSAILADPAAGVWCQHVLTAAECPLLSLLLGHAFPASELPSSLSSNSASKSVIKSTSDSEDEGEREGERLI